MADYTVQTWTDDDGSSTVGTAITKARMDAIEAGIKDAAEHHTRVTSLPTATAALKHSIVILDTANGPQGQAYYCDGSAWTKLGQPENAGVVDITAPDLSRESVTYNGSGAAFGSAARLILVMRIVPSVNMTLTRLRLWLARDASVSFDQDSGLYLDVRIMTDTAGAPGTSLGGNAFPAWKITQSGQWESIPIASIALTAGTTYWIRLTPSVSGGATDLYTVGKSSESSGVSTSTNGSTYTTQTYGIARELKEGTENWAFDGANESAKGGSTLGAMKGSSTTGRAVYGITNNGMGVRGEAERGVAVYGNAHYGACVKGQRQASNSEADLFRGVDETDAPLFRVNKAGHLGIPQVTALPTAPYNGMKVGLLVDAAGTYGGPYVWDCVWNTTAARWLVNAPQMVIESSVNEGAVNSASLWVNLVPAITVPFAGDYDVEVYTNQGGPEAASAYMYLSYKVGAAEAVTTDGILSRATSSADNDFKSLTFGRRKSLVASVVLQMRCFSTSGNVYPTGNGAIPHGIRIRPVKLT